MIPNPTHCAVGGLALALFLGSSGRHLLDVSIRNVEQDTGTLLTAVRTVRIINMVRQYWADCIADVCIS